MSLPKTYIKAHGMGNDFVVFTDFDNNYKLSSDEIKFLCDRHYGVGADGLIRIGSYAIDNHKYFYMDYYNHDGSEANMCGNGVRVTAHVLDYYKHFEFTFTNPDAQFSDNSLQIMTRSGVKSLLKAQRVSDQNEEFYQVDMGEYLYDVNDKEDKTVFCDENLVGYGIEINVGNRHLVFENRNVLDADGELKLVANVDANIEVIDYDSIKQIIRMRVQERGVGETLSCGTGICAVGIYAFNKYGLDSVKVNVKGGDAYTYIKDSHVFLEAPSKIVGEFTLWNV